MKRTGAGILLVVAVLGAGVGFLVDQILTGSGRPTFTPSIMLPILLVALGVIMIVLALPIRRATRSRTAEPVNPFRALRIAMLAKASSIVGAAVGGFAAGLAVFLVSRPAEPSLGSMGTILAAVAGGVALVAAGLVSEQLCTIEKDDDDEPPAAGPDLTIPHH